MADLVSWEYLLLRRAASQQLKAADSMRKLAACYGAFSIRLTAACDAARDQVTRSSEVADRIAAEGARDRARSLAALDGGNLAEMIAERDRLLAARRELDG